MEKCTPSVRISDGLLTGTIKKDMNDNDFFSFEGIPYGQAPVGDLRFKPPMKVQPWKGVKEATSQGPHCFSLVLNNKILQALQNAKPGYPIDVAKFISGSEDCLNLNVYTPELPKKDSHKLRPVMFWIHGGAFTNGDTSQFGPEYLITEDVLLVSTHYRLGALGFLALEDPETEVNGNAGLKDIVLALQWVQKNIKDFNGDPDNVTIFGNSAGGAAVHYLMLSPMAKGLFHKAIAQSGSAQNCWAVGDPNNGKKLAKVLACKRGCKEKDDMDILKRLQAFPVKDIYEAQLKLGDMFCSSDLRLFAPIVDKNSNTPFLPDTPVNLMISGEYNRVPLMTGFTSREAILFLLFPDDEKSLIRSRLHQDDAMLPYYFGLNKECPRYKKIAEKIQRFYYGKGCAKRMCNPTYLVGSDNLFIRGIYTHARHISRTSKRPVYLYRVSARTEVKFLVSVPPDIEGVCHGEELGYLFKSPDSADIPDCSEASTIRKRFLKLWTNFAKTGHPTRRQLDEVITVEWKPFTDKDQYFLDIRTDELSLEKDPEADRMKFWDGICKEILDHTDF